MGILSKYTTGNRRLGICLAYSLCWREKRKRGRCSHPIRAECQVDGASYVFLSHAWGQPWQTPRLDAVFPGPWRRMPTARSSIGGNISPRAPPHGQGPSPATKPHGEGFFLLRPSVYREARTPHACFGFDLARTPMLPPPCRANHLLCELRRRVAMG